MHRNPTLLLCPRMQNFRSQLKQCCYFHSVLLFASVVLGVFTYFIFLNKDTLFLNKDTLTLVAS